jgi:hypothetical protein
MRIARQTLSGLTLAIAVGVTAVLVMLLFRGAEFVIANETPYPVSVVAAWRNQIKDTAPYRRPPPTGSVYGTKRP